MLTYDSTKCLGRDELDTIEMLREDDFLRVQEMCDFYIKLEHYCQSPLTLPVILKTPASNYTGVPLILEHGFSMLRMNLVGTSSTIVCL